MEIKTYDLAKWLLHDLAKYGNRKIEIDLLTENQSNFINITGYYDADDAYFHIECDIENLKEFKHSLQ
jgi:hypothetical protein